MRSAVNLELLLSFKERLNTGKSMLIFQKPINSYDQHDDDSNYIFYFDHLLFSISNVNTTGHNNSKGNDNPAK